MSLCVLQLRSQLELILNVVKNKQTVCSLAGLREVLPTGLRC